MRGWKDAKVWSQKGGMVPKRVGPWEGRGKRAETKEKRLSRVGDSTLGIEVSRDYDDKEKREERREKRE